MRNKSEVAIRRGRFEDTVMLLGEFNVAGHDMQYFLRLSYYGSNKKKHKISAYFALLDDTKREFIEADSNGFADEAIVGDSKLLIRKNNIEISQNNKGLKMYVVLDNMTIDFIVSKDSELVRTGTENAKFDNIVLNSYTYPSCFTVGSCMLGNSYYEVKGRAMYLRCEQEKVDWTSILMRRLSRKGDGDKKKLYLGRGYFHLSNGSNIIMYSGEMGDITHDWCKILYSSGGFDNTEFNPIGVDVKKYVDYAEGKTEPTLFEINSVNGRIRLKFKVFPQKRESLSEDSHDYVMYERFTRIVGTFNDEKVKGYGYISMS